MSVRKHLLATCTALLVSLSCLFAASVLTETEGTHIFDSDIMLSHMDFNAAVPEFQKDFTERSTIQLVTIGRGDPLYAWFGHSSLVVTPPDGAPVMYDYGIFDFKQDHFYQNFALGRLYYSVMATYADWRINEAILEQRDVTIQTLELPLEAKLAVIQFLNGNVKPEYNTYLYHHFNDNCSTRIRDILNAATDGAFKTWAQSIPATGTFRQHVMRHTIASPLIDWGLNFLQSGEIDYPITLWDEMFLPQILELAVEQFSWTWEDGKARPLVQTTTIVNDTTGLGIRAETQATTPHVFLPSLLVGLCMGAIGLLLLWWYKKQRNKDLKYRFPRVLFGLYNGIICLFLGILSTLLLFMMTASTHDVTWYNENIIFANPWLIVMAIQSFIFACSKKGNLHAIQSGFRVLSGLALALLVLKGVLPTIFHQANLQIFAVLLPYYALQGWIIRFAKKER